MGCTMMSKSALARSLVNRSQMDKELKRISEFGRFLQFEEQQRELNALVKRLDIEITLLNRCLELFTGAADKQLLAEVAEKLLTQRAEAPDASQ